VDEYVSMYAEPYHTDLESEQTYPMQRAVSYV